MRFTPKWISRIALGIPLTIGAFSPLAWANPFEELVQTLSTSLSVYSQDQADLKHLQGLQLKIQKLVGDAHQQKIFKGKLNQKKRLAFQNLLTPYQAELQASLMLIHSPDVSQSLVWASLLLNPKNNPNPALPTLQGPLAIITDAIEKLIKELKAKEQESVTLYEQTAEEAKKSNTPLPLEIVNQINEIMKAGNTVSEKLPTLTQTSNHVPSDSISDPALETKEPVPSLEPQPEDPLDRIIDARLKRYFRSTEENKLDVKIEINDRTLLKGIQKTLEDTLTQFFQNHFTLFEGRVLNPLFEKRALPKPNITLKVGLPAIGRNFLSYQFHLRIEVDLRLGNAPGVHERILIRDFHARRDGELYFTKDQQNTVLNFFQNLLPPLIRKLDKFNAFKGQLRDELKYDIQTSLTRVTRLNTENQESEQAFEAEPSPESPPEDEIALLLNVLLPADVAAGIELELEELPQENKEEIFGPYSTSIH